MIYYGLINHWFLLIRPAIKPLILRGGTLGAGRLTSHVYEVGPLPVINGVIAPISMVKTPVTNFVRIQVCPKKGISPIQSYFRDGMFRPSILRIFGKGLDSWGKVIVGILT